MSRKFDYLGDVEAFLAVVEHGSFTAGEVALSTPPSVLSGAVTRLEARLGRQLLQQTTRRVGLTDAGRLYREQVRTAFGLLDDAERDVQGQDGALVGRVRLSVPTTYGHYRPQPVLARFAQQYAQVQLELNITNRNVDLVAEGFDLAIRLGQLPDGGLVSRKLEDAPLLLVAAPDYLQRRGTPQTLDDLQQHLCLPFVMPRTGRLAPWIFRDEGRDVDWLPRSSMETSNDVLGVVSLAEQGIAICQSYWRQILQQTPETGPHQQLCNIGFGGLKSFSCHGLQFRLHPEQRLCRLFGQVARDQERRMSQPISIDQSLMWSPSSIYQSTAQEPLNGTFGRFICRHSFRSE